MSVLVSAFGVFNVLEIRTNRQMSANIQAEQTEAKQRDLETLALVERNRLTIERNRLTIEASTRPNRNP